MPDNSEYKRQLITRSFNLARAIIALVEKFPNKRSAWVITDQLIRSATSIGANIIEAQIEKLLKEVDELTRILGSSTSTLKGKNKL